MSDAALQMLASGDWDFVMYGGDVLADESIRPAVVASLLTDREYPNGAVGERRGWWGDALLADPSDRDGSLLWRVPGKRTSTALLDAKRYAEQALAWMLDDGIARSIKVDAQYDAKGYLQLDIDIAQPNGVSRYRLAHLWQESFADAIPLRAQATNIDLAAGLRVLETIFYTHLPEPGNG